MPGSRGGGTVLSLVVAMTLVVTGLGRVAMAAGGNPPLSRDQAVGRLKEHARASRTDALLVMRDGQILIEEYGAGASKRPIEMMSATKSIVALALVKLVGDGKITSFDMPVHSWYPEWAQGRKRAITLRMLLNHTSGLQNTPNASAEIYPSPDFVQLALAAEIVSDPGTRYSYNNKATNLLAGIVERASGRKLDVWMQEQIFDPLDIRPGAWTRDRAGNPHAMAGLALTAGDAAKLGKLVLDEGRHGHRQLLPRKLVREMLAPGSAVSDDVGLLWGRKPAFTRYSVDDRSFAMLERLKLPASIIDRVRPLDGREFGSQSEMRATLLPALGSDGLAAWTETMIRNGTSAAEVFNAQKGPVVAYQAVGYLGQYIVVVPTAGIVAVRQLEARDAVRESDSWADFADDVLALARTFPEPTPPAQEP